MLTPEQFAGLNAELIDTPALSVYIDGGESDQAKRGEWSRRLAAATNEVREQTEAANSNGLADLSDAIQTLESALDAQGGVKLRQAWAGFITGSTVRYGEVQPVRLPTVVQWKQGMFVSPYLPVLELNPPVVMALLSQQGSRILTYQRARLSETVSLVVDRALADLPDVGVMKSAHTTSGVRGATGRDKAQRSLRSEDEKLAHKTLDAVTEAAGPDGGIIIGGTAESAAALQSRRPERLREQSVFGSTLTFEMSESEILKVLAEHLPEIGANRYAGMLDEVIEGSHEGGKGALGRNATLEALRG